MMSEAQSSVSVCPFERTTADWYERVSGTRAYDLLMRLPAVMYFWLVLDHQVRGTAGALSNALASTELSPFVTLAARLAAITVTVVFISLTLLREQPVKRARGLRPRLAAFLGATFLFASAFLPYAEPSVVWEMASTILSAVGAVLTTMVVLRLGRSFSTMAEARTLVTSGFYSLVRHPLYLAEELIIIGGFLQFRSWPAALIVVLHFVFQLERMRCEEEVLTEAYPEYATYRATTARLIPGVY